jgi:hypothetical protein
LNRTAVRKSNHGSIVRPACGPRQVRAYNRLTCNRWHTSAGTSATWRR